MFVPLATYVFWYVRPVQPCFVHGKEAVLASHVSMDSNARGISSRKLLSIYIYNIGRAIMSHCSSWSKNLSQYTGKVKREKGVKTQVSGWECQGDGANGAGSLCSEERAHYASHRARHLEGRLRYSPERSVSHH
jgi:hypothetical protein